MRKRVNAMQITVLYVGSSLLAPLKNAEREINRAYRLDLRVAAHNFGAPLSDREWQEVDRDLGQSNIVFVIHVMDGENASRLVAALDSYRDRHDAVVVINCMPELMRHTRMGRLDVKRLGSTGAWIGKRAKHRNGANAKHHQYLKLVDRLPGILKFIPTVGALTDAKHYLYLFCYFLQPTPANIQSMLLYSLKHYAHDKRLRSVKTSTPQQVPSVAIYHPEATKLFETFEAYEKWHGATKKKALDPELTIGLLLMRPQVVSKTTKHYDALIKAIENEGLSVIPAIATLMDNREAVTRFFRNGRSRVSQIVSLTGFSFVGGPAMNDSAAATRDRVKLAIVLFCFPPNKGNIGTAADLDVFPSVFDLLKRLASEGYSVGVPATADELRERLLGGNSDQFGLAANVAYRMTTSEYLRLCPYVGDVEKDWGAAPGAINAFGGELLIQGLMLGNIFIGVQPTFGFEGDPMRLMMARSGSPHHGFMAFYTYLSKVFSADGVIHFGTHGALEFMPGKQIGLSGECWPDRLIDELPNFYVYSVNNPSEGSIAKRRSYAELISYLTPPIENAGLYRDLAGLRDLVLAYRQSTNETEREKLFESIEALSTELHL